MRRLFIFWLAAASLCAQGIPYNRLRITPTATASATGEIDFYSKDSSRFTPVSVDVLGHTITIQGTTAFAGLDVQNGWAQSEGGFVSNAGIWNGVNSSTDGASLAGYAVVQNGAVTAGGYVDYAPITYNPYNSGSECFDSYGNEVNQPMPLPGISSFALGTVSGTWTAGNTITLSAAIPSWMATSEQLVGIGIMPGAYITGINTGAHTITVYPALPGSGSGVTISVFNNQILMWNSPSPSMPWSQSCGVPLPANTLYGVNVSGYLFPRGGVATDLPYFNSIQSMIGGVFGRALFTSDYYNAASGVCSPTGTCGGAYYNTGGSNGIPTLIPGDSFHGGARYWDTSLNADRVYNGSAFQSDCLDPGTAGEVLFDNGTICTVSADLAWNNTGHVLTVAGSSSAGVVAPVFNSTQTGASIAFQLNNNDFLVDGNGNVTASGQVSAAYHLFQNQSASPTVGAGLGGLWTNSSGVLSYRYGTGTVYAFLDSTGNITGQQINGNTGMVSPVFNSTQTGASIAFQLNNNKFLVDGNGNVTASGQVSAAFDLFQDQSGAPSVGSSLGALWTDTSGNLNYKYQSGSAYAFIDSSGDITAQNLTIHGTCSGCPSGGSYSAGNGISISGSVISANLTQGTGVTITTGSSDTIAIGQSVATSASPNFAGASFSGTVTSTMSSSTSDALDDTAGSWRIHANGNSQFQQTIANDIYAGSANSDGSLNTANGVFEGGHFENPGWDFNSFGYGTIAASAYYAGTAPGVSGSTCTVWTDGLCTHL